LKAKKVLELQGIGMEYDHKEITEVSSFESWKN